MDMEAQILEIIRDMLSSPYGEARLPLKDITSWFVDRHGMDYERKVTSKWIGTIIRKKLNLKTQKSHGVYVIPLSEKPKLDRLYEKYGIGAKEAEEPEADETYSQEPVSDRSSERNPGTAGPEARTEGGRDGQVALQTESPDF